MFSRYIWFMHASSVGRSAGQSVTEMFSERAGERKCISKCGSKKESWDEKGKPTAPETSDAKIFFRSSSSFSSLSVASLGCEEASAPLEPSTGFHKGETIVFCLALAGGRGEEVEEPTCLASL
jgi:hypothetical protein